MSDFDRWFLLAYTIYFTLGIAALMWIGSARPPRPRRSGEGDEPRGSTATLARFWNVIVDRASRL